MTLPSWNLNQFYESIEDNQINKDFKNLNSISKKFQNKYRGKLDSLSSESLLNSLKTLRSYGTFAIPCSNLLLIS